MWGCTPWTPPWPWICWCCAVDRMTCRRVPLSSTICCMTWPGGTCTGIGIGGDPLWDTIGTVTGPAIQNENEISYLVWNVYYYINCRRGKMCDCFACLIWNYFVDVEDWCLLIWDRVYNTWLFENGVVIFVFDSVIQCECFGILSKLRRYQCYRSKSSLELSLWLLLTIRSIRWQ